MELNDVGVRKRAEDSNLAINLGDTVRVRRNRVSSYELNRDLEGETTETQQLEKNDRNRDNELT